MINEDTIRLTKFYMGEDGKCYLVRDVRTVKIVTLICTRDGTESNLLLGDDICSRFEPAEASFEPFVQKQVTAEKPVIIKPQQSEPGPETPTIKGKSGSRNPFSKYKGVTRGKPKKDGSITYRAHIWDGKQGKNLMIGTFDEELLAAAAVHDYKGNKEEAQRLRNLAATTSGITKQQRADIQEQVDNNPDRPSHPAKKKKSDTVYVCKRCGTEWEIKPKQCRGCGCDDFREVEKEAE